MKQNIEPSLRMSISYIRNAQGHIQRLPWEDSPSLGYAMGAMDNAIDNIRDWAKANEIEIKDSMQT